MGANRGGLCHDVSEKKGVGLPMGDRVKIYPTGNKTVISTPKDQRKPQGEIKCEGKSHDVDENTWRKNAIISLTDPSLKV